MVGLQNKVLIVDDNDDARAVLASMAKRHGCTVIEVRDGDEAIEMGKDSVPI